MLYHLADISGLIYSMGSLKNRYQTLYAAVCLNHLLQVACPYCAERVVRQLEVGDGTVILKYQKMKKESLNPDHLRTKCQVPFRYIFFSYIEHLDHPLTTETRPHMSSWHCFLKRDPDLNPVQNFIYKKFWPLLSELWPELWPPVVPRHSGSGWDWLHSSCGGRRKWERPLSADRPAGTAPHGTNAVSDWWHLKWSGTRQKKRRKRWGRRRLNLFFILNCYGHCNLLSVSRSVSHSSSPPSPSWPWVGCSSPVIRSGFPVGRADWSDGCCSSLSWSSTLFCSHWSITPHDPENAPGPALHLHKPLRRRQVSFAAVAAIMSWNGTETPVVESS